MHRAAELGNGQLRVLRAKADGIGEVACIGAAAHGKRGGVVARHLIVGVDAGLDGGGVRLDVERLVHADVGQLGTAANGSLDLLLDGLAVGTGGETAVQRLDDAAMLHINTPANDGQGAKGAISTLDAQTLTGRGAVQLLLSGTRARRRCRGYCPAGS